MELNKFRDLRFSIARAKEESEKNKFKRISKYPVNFLNDFLFGILPSELVVIGADTGVGKTQFVNDIAITNALANNKVYVISLEGDKDDFIKRLQWRIITREYYKKPFGLNMHYGQYVANKIQGIEKFQEIADKEIEELNDYLKIFDRTVDFSIDTLTQQIELIKDDADLIIIDHLHYFSLFDEQSEAVQISKIMKTIKSLTENYRIPIVLVSHLRKKDKNRGVPDNEDFMGSSNIAKVSSTAIIIHPYWKMNVDNMYATLFRITKNRNGMKGDIGFVVHYDMKTAKYLDKYILVRINEFNQVITMAPEEYPLWAKQTINKLPQENKIIKVKEQQLHYQEVEDLSE